MSKRNDTIPLKTAKEWTQEWRDNASPYNKQPHHIKTIAFNIPAQDLLELLQEEIEFKLKPTKKGFKVILKNNNRIVRAYIGVKKTTNQGIDHFEKKLMIVGVDKNGKDMLPSGTENKGSIYDFTTPCPSSCDPTSPLM